jgi:hypothetical protein
MIRPAPIPFCMPVAMMTPPDRAPLSPPVLKKPWNDDRIGRPSAASTSVAWVLIATFAAPPIRPSSSAPTKIIGTVVAMIGTIGTAMHSG